MNVNRKGIERLLDDFLTELLSNSIQFRESNELLKNNYVYPEHFCKKLNIKRDTLIELIDCANSDRYITVLYRAKNETDIGTLKLN